MLSRYDNAVLEAKGKGNEPILRAFENAVAQSQAVIARPVREIDRLASSDRQLYASYYQLLGARVQLPADDDWSFFRTLADETLFHGYKEQIRFAALTLDGKGLENYGDFFMVLREEMIAERATVFEENTVIWMKRLNPRFTDSDKLPAGYRAAWRERGQLGVIKIGGKLEATTTPNDFVMLLLSAGADSSQDNFIEVHIYGELTIHSVKQLILGSPARKAQKTQIKKLKENLAKLNADVEVIT